MARTKVSDEVWDEFHQVVNMTSRSQRGDPPEPTAGDASWRHSLMSVGHDPLKPA